MHQSLVFPPLSCLHSELESQNLHIVWMLNYMRKGENTIIFCSFSFLFWTLSIFYLAGSFFIPLYIRTSIHWVFSTVDSERLTRRLGQKDNETAAKRSRGRRRYTYINQQRDWTWEERALCNLQEIRCFVGDTEQT